MNEYYIAKSGSGRNVVASFDALDLARAFQEKRAEHGVNVRIFRVVVTEEEVS